MQLGVAQYSTLNCATVPESASLDAARDTWSKKEHDMTEFKRFIADESGATAIEYSLIAALMAAAIIAALSTFKTDLSTAFTNIGTTLKNNTK
jgi:pilus assembly protein Flp/PilA